MALVFPEYDQLREELRGRISCFLPDKIFDAHMHIQSDVTAGDYLAAMKRELPHVKDLRAMMIPMPTLQMSTDGGALREQAAQHMVHQLNEHPEMVGQIYVLPQDRVEDIGRLADHPGIRGLKCYYYSAPNAGQADVSEFLPESAWQFANETCKAITLHLSRTEALADPGHMEYIEKMAGAYPNAKLILAHCGRAFASWTCMESVKKLCRYKNVFFDLSAICEPAPMFYCLKYAGVERVLWGSDFPISGFSGRAVSVGDSFAWVGGDALRKANPEAVPMTVFHENLLAVYTAADMLELDRTAVEAIFYHNAQRLL